MNTINVPKVYVIEKSKLPCASLAAPCGGASVWGTALGALR